jgi:cell division protein ZapA (FtsZ GTPase activity inhibitor)
VPPKDDRPLLEYRISELEKGLETVSDKIDKLLTNHLPHIQQEIQDLREESRISHTKSDTKINVMTAINVGSVIIGILVTNFILK